MREKRGPSAELIQSLKKNPTPSILRSPTTKPWALYFPGGTFSPASSFPSHVVESASLPMSNSLMSASRKRTRTNFPFASYTPRLIVPSSGGGAKLMRMLRGAGVAVGDGVSWATELPASHVAASASANVLVIRDNNIAANPSPEKCCRAIRSSPGNLRRYFHLRTHHAAD